MAARVGVGNRPRGAGSAFGPVTTTTATTDITKAGVNQTSGQGERLCRAGDPEAGKKRCTSLRDRHLSNAKGQKSKSLILYARVRE